MKLPIPYRQATQDDAESMAELIDIAGEGMPFYLWSKMAEPDQSPWAVGRERAQRESGSFSYRNAVVRDDGGRVTAALIGYALPEEPKPIDRDTLPPMFVPLQELESLAPGTWYVNAIAAYPDCRGKGYGKELLAIAEQRASELGCRGMSLIVADANVGARRLYERVGYREIARRPMVKEQWDGPGEQWVLLVK